MGDIPQIAREHVHESCTALRRTSTCAGVDVRHIHLDGQRVISSAPGTVRRRDRSLERSRASAAPSSRHPWRRWQGGRADIEL